MLRALETRFDVVLVVAGATPHALPAGELRLLFVGVEWDRKGGPLALAIVEALAAQGIACRLDIVGCGADVLATPVPANVAFHGYVSKASAEGRALIEQLFAAASFILLPTTAECYGIVFAEAAAHVLPTVSFATGGVPSVVIDGVTGMLLPLGASAEAFAGAITEIVATPGPYAEMSRAALDDARHRLDWEVWADGVVDAVERRLAT